MPVAAPKPEEGSVPRAIEVGFPIVEINRLAEPERNSFKPIYQMHKWFARRASCVFRAILLGSLKPAFNPDGTAVDLMEEFYKDHSNDTDTKGKVVLDPFMGGGTTVVEALRLGCKVVGIDLNPVAWFIVKSEVEPVDIEALKNAFERLAARPVAWNDGKPLRDSLLDLYRTEVQLGLDADVIYTFWVKHAICTDPTCKKEVPLFKDYLVAAKSLSVKYHRDVHCPACKKSFDWEVGVASMIAEQEMMVNSPRGSAGEGRPQAAWTYAPEPPKPKSKRETSYVEVACPHCDNHQRLQVPDKKKERKKVPLAVLLCPACEAVWQWRGSLPDGEVSCPACKHSYDPKKGNIPEDGYFQCRCGNKDRIIESIRLQPQERRLPVRPYALQAYIPPEASDGPESADNMQQTLFDAVTLAPTEGTNVMARGMLLPENGKFFKRWSTSDQARLQRAEMLWEKNKAGLPYPKSTIPVGEKTKSGLLSHHYNHWHEMFAPRQLLALSTLLAGIMAEEDQAVKEMLLTAFFSLIEGSNLFARYKKDQNKSETAKGVFARHDFHSKVTPVEDNVWGAAVGKGFRAWFEIVLEGKAFAVSPSDNFYHHTPKGDQLERKQDGSTAVATVSEQAFDGDVRALVRCHSSIDQIDVGQINAVITDPPYAGNVNYAELADFFYVWLRLALKDRYPWFAPEHTPKGEEIIENRSRGKSREDFYKGLSAVFQRVHDQLQSNGLLVFTFHHTDQKGTVWEGLLQALCDTGFEIAAVYPVQSEAESSSHHQDKENISYDLIHVCRKRREDPTARSWAGIRQEVRRLARAELSEIEKGRYGNKPLPEPDVRLICIGKCLELYSAHYDRVLDHEGKTYPLHKALQDISSIVDQLVTRERPLPPELEDVDSLTYAWLRLLAEVRREVSVDKISKYSRAIQVSTDDLKRAGLIIRGRTGRGRTYEVKQPNERLEALLEKLRKASQSSVQGSLLEEAADRENIPLVDLLHTLIALADAGESVLPWLERFDARRTEILAGLRFVRELRSDWVAAIDKVVAVIEGAPLLRQGGAI